MNELVFVCWKWKSDFHNDRSFTAKHVNILRASVARHYSRPHRFVCITDDSQGLAPSVEPFPMPITGLESLRTLRSPAIRRNSRGHVVRRIQFPSCYRRLWMFSDEAKQIGEWVFCLDVDCLVVGKIEPLVDNFPGDFVGWLRAPNPRRVKPALAGAVYKLRTGSHTEVWDEFHPVNSPLHASHAGYSGSDQAWMSYRLLPRKGMWTDEDGLGKPHEHGLRPTDRILFTAGYAPPWSPDYHRKRPWVGDHWRAIS